MGKGFTSDSAKNAGSKSKRGKSEKTKQWEVLGDSIMNEHTEKFNEELNKLEGKEFIQAYGMILEYFKPKQLRTEVKDETIREIIVKLPEPDEE